MHRCQQYDDKIDQIISACLVLVKEQWYQKRQNEVCAQMRFNICKETGVKLEKEHWYKNVPKSVEITHESKVTVQ
jgi:hypothetical protein